MPTDDTIAQTTPFYLWDTTAADSTLQVLEVNLGIPMDSIFPPIDRPEPLQRNSLFTHHGMPLLHEQPVARRNDAEPAWMFIVLMALTVLLVVYYRTRKISLGELLKSTIDSHATDRLVRSCNMVRVSTLVPAGLLTVAMLSVAVFQAAMVHTGPGGYLLLTGGIAVAYLLRNLVVRLLGNVFDSKENVSAYITSNYLYHLVLATAVLPLLFLQVYMPWGNMVVLYVIVALTVLVFVLRLSRGVKVFLTNSKGSSFYLFYYLCTIEIVPFLVLTKWLFD
ncbi:MAG: DUF4271 domain-containing protein [Bacteroidales bacterium]|nr:DUF4271 domain-containing protein [Bacteroidales bacterium]